MAEALKHRYNVEYVSQLASVIGQYHPAFKQPAFIKSIFSPTWESYELKQRMHHITRSLHRFLPSNYPDALDILLQSCPHFSGFEAMFFPDFVEQYGLDDYQRSVEALAIMTRYSSSEFAVRPFIIRYPELMMQQMLDWTESDNEHVRRLASEGCRPRLPWAMALPQFKQNPGPVLPILERLKDDPSNYVARSVANNLNDISRDHASIIIEKSRKWQNSSERANWIIKHACRSLLKQGNHDALALFGYLPPRNMQLKAFECRSEVAMGERLPFAFELNSADSLGFCRVEYQLDFVRAKGQHNGKVFMISDRHITDKQVIFSRHHSFKPISTRRYYSGLHRIHIRVNGMNMGSQEFRLVDK